jgi:hypothetical protein
MPYITSVERYGREQGLRQGLMAGFELCLKLKFGLAGLQLLPELGKVQDVEVLRAVFLAIETAPSVDELRRLIP